MIRGSQESVSTNASIKLFLWFFPMNILKILSLVLTDTGIMSIDVS